MDHRFKSANLANNRKKKSLPKRTKILIGFICLILGISLIWPFFSSSPSNFNYSFGNPFKGNAFKSTDDRVNILLLGNAGGRHDGAELTDSIIVASYHLKTNQATLISIPRDLWVDATKSKINAIYEYGELSKNGGNGLRFAQEKISEIVGLPIHYGIRLDFDGFERAIDIVGGVDVEVPKTFDDYNYPIKGKENDLCGLMEKELDLNEEQIKQMASVSAQLKLKPGKNKVLVDSLDKIATSSADFSCRFEHIHFDKGNLKMEGETALKFVRSRMGTNGEGSDFARSRRQQAVIQAFRQKALSLKTFTNPKIATELVVTLGTSVETDIPLERYLDFYNLSKKVLAIKSLVLGDLGNGKSILYVPPPADYAGAFVLVPENEDFTKIKEFIKQELDKQVAQVSNQN